MGFFDRFLSWFPQGWPSYAPAPQAAAGDGGTIATTPAEIEALLRHGESSVRGANALATPAVYGCVRILSGTAANLPFDVKRRLTSGERVDATETPLWRVLKRKPNRWQKPAQFKRMMQAHVLLRGNAYALKVLNTRGEVMELLPLDPDRMVVKQADDLTLTYEWTTKKGGLVTFRQEEILHLYGLTLDGYRGVTPLTYARETLEGATAMRRHGNAVFRNGANVTGALSTEKSLSDTARERLKASLEEFRSGGAREGKAIILEEGLKYQTMALTAEDAQWIEAQNFSRVEICMFFGVPPHKIGHTEGNTQLGSSIAAQGQDFTTYALEDYLTMWEEALTADCLDERRQADLYVRINRAALVRGDFAARWDGYVKALQWGVFSPNEIRALEDENPRADGDIYYQPPNTAGSGPAASQEPTR